MADTNTSGQQEIEEISGEEFGEEAGEAEEEEWPEWFQGFRAGQEHARDEVVAAFKRGARVVFLDAPTGSGKTLVAEMVRRAMGLRSVYVCHSRQLQQQFLGDYPYARLLEGRANYPTLNNPAYSADDCTGPGCQWCPSRAVCPYIVAKKQALVGRLAVLNTAYFLAEANSQGAFGRKVGKRGEVQRPAFVVADECDTLEAALMGYVELRVGSRVLHELGLRAPLKGSRAATVEAWRTGELIPAIEEKLGAMGKEEQFLPAGSQMPHLRAVRQYQRLLWQVRQVELRADDDEGDRGELWGDWVRVYEPARGYAARARGPVGTNPPEPFILRPVVVGRAANRYLWRHADRWLCMSATVISAQEQADSLGLEQARIPWAVVKMPMRFPVRDRQVVVKPVANMVHKEAGPQGVEWPKLAAGLRGVCAQYPGENMLVHTVSYRLAEYLHEELVGREELAGRLVHRYVDARGRDEMVRAFRAVGGVLLAPSLERGIDLPGDLCRVVVVAKVPFPNLGDRRVAARLRRPGGRVWYDAMVARGLVQMTGRGVRYEGDWAVSWVLDKQFARFYNKSARLLPRWWRDALAGNANVHAGQPTT